ncbi:hypothetical protein GCM10025873_03690 [Demequina sediminis]|nr:hypothetical protein GCM10025873_03690 [Demequina sediminis]
MLSAMSALLASASEVGVRWYARTRRAGPRAGAGSFPGTVGSVTFALPRVDGFRPAIYIDYLAGAKAAGRA